MTIPNYFNGYLQHPYLSLYTGRGCKSKCTFCLWPQTIGGHLYRVRSVDSVEAEMTRAKQLFPEVREYFFDDDTLTDNGPRVEEIARRLGRIGITWSCNAKPNVPRSTLEIMRANGLRLLLVGYESGNQQVLNNMKKGTRLDIIRRFSKDCRELGIKVHGTFIFGNARRNARDDPRDDQVCVRDGSGNDPGFAGRAVSGNVSSTSRLRRTAGSRRRATISSTRTACSTQRSIIPV